MRARSMLLFSVLLGATAPVTAEGPSSGEDLKATIDALKQAMAGQPAGQAIENLRLAGRDPVSPAPSDPR